MATSSTSGIAVGVVKVAVLAPIFSLYALWFVASATVRLIVSLGWARRLLGRTIACETCGASNELDARWSCASCGATYLGFVGECRVCGVRAAHFPCVACRAAIQIGPVS